jgi:hypothetical protein
LALHAPRQFYVKHYLACLHYLMAGRRVKGLTYWVKCLAKRPFSPRLWFLGSLGLLGGTPLAYAYCWIQHSLPAALRALRRSGAAPATPATCPSLVKE